MKKFKFKDGSIITASTVEEAKQKHKVMAATDKDLQKIKKEISGFVTVKDSYEEDTLNVCAKAKYKEQLLKKTNVYEIYFTIIKEGNKFYVQTSLGENHVIIMDKEKNLKTADEVIEYIRDEIAIFEDFREN